MKELSYAMQVFIFNTIILCTEMIFFTLKALGVIKVSWWFMIIPIIFMANEKDKEE